MEQNFDKEILIDFNKVINSVIKNKKEIFICFLITMSFGLLFYFLMPKKYVSEAKILIKRTGSTNLSYINPYIISDTAENNNSNLFFDTKNSLAEEIEIIKSPIIIDNTIKENNLKYKNGIRKGNFLSTDDFLKKNFNLSKIKDTDIIYVSYKSEDPELSYNIVNSIIDNYKLIQGNWNLEKASSDIIFLKNACLKAENDLNSKINQLKKYNNKSETLSGGMLSNINMLGFYDKRLKQKLKQASDNEINFKKAESEIAQKTEELANLKKKLEWVSMVKEMSKNTTNIIILQRPEIKEKYAFSEPQPLVIFILCLFSWIFLCIPLQLNKR